MKETIISERGFQALQLNLVSLFLGFVVFIIFWKISQGNGKSGIINRLPGPTAYPLVGNIFELLEPREKVLQNVMMRHKKFGPIFRIWVGSQPIIIFSRPEDIEILLKSSKHSEKAFSYKFLHSWLGTGLLTSHGKKWAIHRKLITPTFHFKVLQSFVDVFHRNSNILANKLMAKAVTKEEFDIYSYVTLCTLDIICETAMGTKVNAQMESQNQYVRSVYSLSALIVKRINRVWLHPDFLFKVSCVGKEFRNHLNIVKGFTEKVIKMRKEALKQKKNSPTLSKEEGGKSTFLDLLLESSTEGGSSLLTDEELREEVDTFMFEGHDTTASAISYALTLLGSHPKIQEDCYQEIKEIFGNDPNKAPTLTDLAELKLLERIIKETLRMYPSVMSIGRIVEEDVQFGKYLIPKGTDAVIAIYSMHRDPKYYPNPEKFDPDRFLPENSLMRHPYSYIPFSAGPRNCIGQKFALLEEKVVLATLLRNYKFESMEPADKIEIIPELIIRPKSGIRIKISKR